MLERHRKFERINKNICKAMDTDLNMIGFAFLDGVESLEIPDLYEFCKWWVKTYPDKFIKLKGCLYEFRANKAKLFASVDAIFDYSMKSEKKLHQLTALQVQMLINNCIDQTNSTCQLVQSVVRMCENILKGK